MYIFFSSLVCFFRVAVRNQRRKTMFLCSPMHFTSVSDKFWLNSCLILFWCNCMLESRVNYWHVKFLRNALKYRKLLSIFLKRYVPIVNYNDLSLETGNCYVVQNCPGNTCSMKFGKLAETCDFSGIECFLEQSGKIIVCEDAFFRQ